METLNTAGTITLFEAMADAMEASKEHLCELDGVIGDADHGITMAMGFNAVRSALSDFDQTDTTPTDVFNLAAKTFLNAVGASAGPLYATAFMRAGAVVKGQPTIDVPALSAMIVAMAKGIQSRGKAEAGDKTMLDAWLPAAEAAELMKDAESLTTLMSAVEQAAQTGAQNTIPMLAKKGRSAKLGERTIGHMDAGAASTALLLGAMASAISSN